MIGMILFATIVGGGLAPADRKAACGASLALIRSQVAMRGGPVIYTTWTGAAERDFDPDGYQWSPLPYAKAQPVPMPTARGIKRSYHLDNLRFSAVHHCQSVRRFLNRHHVPYGANAADQALRKQDRKVMFISVSLAAVGASGRHAVVTFGSTSLFGGGGWATMLVRDSVSRWHLAYSKPTWIT